MGAISVQEVAQLPDFLQMQFFDFEKAYEFRFEERVALDNENPTVVPGS